MQPIVEKLRASLLLPNQRLWNGPGRRMLLLKWLLCTALLAEMAMCPVLWTSDRGFSVVPVFSGLSSSPSGISVALAWLLCAATLGIAVLPRPKRAIWLALATATLLVLLDLNRLQPWLYEYLLCFAFLILMDWDDPESARANLAWALCGFLVVATYFWSGLQKVNYSFADIIFPFLLHPFGLSGLKSAWLVGPIFESTIGILFLIPRTRMVGVVACVAMHLFLLAALGPFGQNYNSIVWPWNVFMPAVAATLFLKNRRPILPDIWKSAQGKAVVALVGVLPALNFLGLWDDNLSFTLYSGRAASGYLMLTEVGALALPPDAQDRLERGPQGIRLDLYNWAIGEMNAPPYAEPRAYKATAQALERRGIAAGDMKLLISDRVSYLTSKRTYSVHRLP